MKDRKIFVSALAFLLVAFCTFSAVYAENFVFDGVFGTEYSDSLKMGELKNPNKTIRVRVKNDGAKVHAAPSASSPVVATSDSSRTVCVFGVGSDNPGGNGEKGVWLQVSPDNYTPDLHTFWMFSGDLDIGLPENVGEMVLSAKIDDSGRNKLLVLVDATKNNGENAKSEPFWMPIHSTEANGKLYFAVNFDFNFFSPLANVGTYCFNPSDGKVERVSALGNGMMSSWSVVTKDGKFVVCDFGTSMGLRALRVYDNSTHELLFEGNYKVFDKILDGNRVNFVKVHNVMVMENVTDKNVLKFIKKNPLPEEIQNWYDNGFDFALIEKCTYDPNKRSVKSVKKYEYVKIQ